MRHGFVALALSLAAAVAAVEAQSAADKYQAWLSPLPVTGATVATITGKGIVTATLSGSRLAIDGTFSGLAGPATTANIRRAPRAMRGDVIAELSVPKETSGKLTATVDLTPAQVADLRAGNLYVQIHSERATDGSIRGWLLK